jgi:hypothetical protein
MITFLSQEDSIGVPFEQLSIRPFACLSGNPDLSAVHAIVDFAVIEMDQFFYTAPGSHHNDSILCFRIENIILTTRQFPEHIIHAGLQDFTSKQN